MAEKVKETTNTTTTTVKPAEAATMEQYKASPYYNTLGIKQLQEQMAGYSTDADVLRGQAETLYKPTYDTEKQAIRHQLEQEKLAYEGQLAGVGAAYDQQRRKTNQSYNESATTLNNALTKRGLGRSSLVSTQGAYLENKRQQALSDIGAQETADIKSINDKIALIASQAAQKEATLDANYAAQIESRINELREKNQSAATSLQLQIATLQQQGYQAYQDWLLKNRQMEQEQKNLDREYEMQQKQYADDLAQQQWENEFAQNQYDTSVEQWQKEYDAQQALADRNQANADREYELQKALQDLNKLNADRNHDLALREQQLAEDQFAWQKEQAAAKASAGGSGGSKYSGSNTQSNNPASQQEQAPDSDGMIDKLMGDQNNKLAAAQKMLTSIRNNAKSGVNIAASVLNKDVKKQNALSLKQKPKIGGSGGRNMTR